MDARTIQAYLEAKYNHFRMELAQVASELGISVRTAQNQISLGTFPVPTFVLGRERQCLVTHVAEHIARLAAEGENRHAALRRRLGLD